MAGDVTRPAVTWREELELGLYPRFVRGAYGVWTPCVWDNYDALRAHAHVLGLRPVHGVGAVGAWPILDFPLVLITEYLTLPWLYGAVWGAFGPRYVVNVEVPGTAAAAAWLLRLPCEAARELAAAHALGGDAACAVLARHMGIPCVG